MQTTFDSFIQFDMQKYRGKY